MGFAPCTIWFEQAWFEDLNFSTPNRLPQSPLWLHRFSFMTDTRRNYSTFADILPNCNVTKTLSHICIFTTTDYWAVGLAPTGAMAGLGCALRTSGLNFQSTDQVSICYIAFSYFRTFKRFSFWSMPIGLEPMPSGPQTASLLTSYTRTSNLCRTNSIVVHSIIELACTMRHTQYGFILTTQYF